MFITLHICTATATGVTYCLVERSHQLGDNGHPDPKKLRAGYCRVRRWRGGPCCWRQRAVLILGYRRSLNQEARRRSQAKVDREPTVLPAFFDIHLCHNSHPGDFVELLFGTQLFAERICDYHSYSFTNRDGNTQWTLPYFTARRSQKRLHLARTKWQYFLRFGSWCFVYYAVKLVRSCKMCT